MSRLARSASGPACARDDAPCGGEVRAIEHSPADVDGPGSRLLLEGGDDRVRFAQCLIARREDVVDGLQLCRMDRRLRAETRCDCSSGFDTQALYVAKVSVNRVDRRNTCGSGAEQAETARKL